MLARGEVLPPAAALAQGVCMASLPAHVVASVLSGNLRNTSSSGCVVQLYYCGALIMQGHLGVCG